METVAEINGKSYSSISAPVIDRALFTDKLSVGNCITSTLKFSVLTDDEIPRSARVVIKSRISDDTDTSEWLVMGTFYIDNRTTNNGMTALTCYDSMLKASQQYVDDTLTDGRIGWPHTMQSCVNEIAQRMGLTLDSRTTIRTGDPYQVDYPAKLTMMQVLGYIGACHGGNWIVTPENKLRLVPLVAPRTGSETHPAGGGAVTVPVVTGSLKTGKPLTISRVTLGYDSEIGYTEGDDTGHELRIENNPYASRAICQDLYAWLNGMQYVPYQLDGACYDPAAEMGDWLVVGDVSSVLFAQTATHNVNFRCNVNAPGKEEASSEYPHLTTIERLQQKDEQLQKYIENAETEFNSSIEQTRQRIVLEVERARGEEERLESKIEQMADSITLSVTNTLGGSTFTLTGDGIETQSATVRFSMAQDDVQSVMGTVTYPKPVDWAVNVNMEFLSATGFIVKREANNVVDSSYSIVPLDGKLIECATATDEFHKFLALTNSIAPGNAAIPFYEWAYDDEGNVRLRHKSWGDYSAHSWSAYCGPDGFTAPGITDYGQITVDDGCTVKATDSEVSLSNGDKIIAITSSTHNGITTSRLQFYCDEYSYLSLGSGRPIHIRSGSNEIQMAGGATIDLAVNGCSIQATDGNGSTYGIEFDSSRLYVNGNRVETSSSSSQRYKHSITDKLDPELDPHRLYDLPVKQYVYNDGHRLQYEDMKGQTLPGFIAEDVDRVYPSAVIHDEQGRVESWDERRIVPGMLALIQEQKQEIDTLKAEIKSIKEALHLD
jgi:hypothetical protein